LFKILKFIFYISSLIACYFAYTDTISWWWVFASIAATTFFQYWAAASKTASLTAVESLGSKDEIDGPTNFELEMAKETVMEFGQAMMKVDHLNKIHDASNLPLEKEKILEAFVILYRATGDDEKRNLFKLGLMALSRFQDDIGKEPVAIALDPATHTVAEKEYIKNCLELDT
jgi:hypothetical protein